MKSQIIEQITYTNLSIKYRQQWQELIESIVDELGMEYAKSGSWEFNKKVYGMQESMGYGDILLYPMT